MPTKKTTKRINDVKKESVARRKRYLSFAKRFNKLLKASGMTRAELARKIKVSETTISRYLNGERMPDALCIVDICKSFGLESADYLLGLKK